MINSMSKIANRTTFWIGKEPRSKYSIWLIKDFSNARSREHSSSYHVCLLFVVRATILAQPYPYINLISKPSSTYIVEPKDKHSMPYLDTYDMLCYQGLSIYNVLRTMYIPVVEMRRHAWGTKYRLLVLRKTIQVIRKSLKRSCRFHKRE